MRYGLKRNNMDKKHKVVIDTNILVSASFRKISPIPNRIYQALKTQQFILVTSSDIMEEVEDVINRDYVIARSHMNEEARKEFIEVLIDVSIFTSGQTVLQNVSRDTEDNKFLVCAYETKADYIITGDEDLLVLGEYEGTKIIKPKEFVDLLDL